jgi:hypothetical protein
MKKLQPKFFGKLLLHKNSLSETEFENVKLSELFDEKDPLYIEYLRAEAEYEKLKSDLQTFRKKARLRENELRTHIFELSEKLKVRDVNRLKTNMNQLKDEIIGNINIITERTRDEIMSRKGEISKRTQTRLMDTEVRHQNILSERVRDQDDIVKNLNDYTREMEKVSSNYTSIKRKVETLTKENTGYKIMIREYELKNEKLKIELSRLKKLMVMLKLKVGKSLTENELKSYDSNNNTLIEKNNTQLSENKNLEDLKSIEQDFSNNDDDESYTKKKYPNLTIEKISEILSNENFLKNHPRSSAVISSLANILENSKIRVNKLTKEVENHRQSTEVTNMVLEVMKNSKINLVSSDDYNVQKIFKKSKSHSLVFKNEVYMSRDQRKQFINNLVNNPGIQNIIHNENFPSASIITRKIVIPK